MSRLRDQQIKLQKDAEKKRQAEERRLEQERLREEETKRQYLDKIRKTNKSQGRESFSKSNSEKDWKLSNSREGDRNAIDLPKKLTHASTDIIDINLF